MVAYDNDVMLTDALEEDDESMLSTILMQAKQASVDQAVIDKGSIHRSIDLIDRSIH